MSLKRAGLALGLASLVSALALAQRPAPAPSASAILKARCVACHGATKPAGGLDLSPPAAFDQNAARIAQVVSAGKMPPSMPLPAAERAVLLAGNVPKPLWSLAPLRSPSLPTSPFDRLAITPVDRFLFATLAQKGLRPAPLADRRALLRRVSCDLIGLPPTPEETAAFLADERPGAYERVVDRLLASPAYGEKWGRKWLDVVRFGESNGYERNLIRTNAWPYRDWVVQALNADLPYSTFVTAQLAGDVTGAPAATGFLVAGCHDDVGSPLEELSRSQRASDLDDIVSTTAEAFLGLTVGCARCHDHKFDPIAQRDYYRLCAVFAGVQHAERPLEPPKKTGARETERQTFLARLAERAAPESQLSPRGNTESFPPTRARFVRMTISATAGDAEPCLDELAIFGVDPAVNLALAGKATAGSALPGFAIHQVAHLNDGKRGNERSWIGGERGRGWAQIELAQTAEVSRVLWARDTAGQFGDRLASRYQIELSTDGVVWQTVATQASHTKAALKEPDPQTSALLAQIETLRNETTAYIGQFRAPDPVYFLHRGDVLQRGEVVPPGGIAALGALPEFPAQEEPARRKALAAWIARRDNPLTWRVAVNRLWQGHFGTGLVGTPSDFGNNGERPSHPEFLDYLASRFRDGGGHAKALHRLLVLSYAYRQSAQTTPTGLRVDAGNRLVWRGPLRRLDAEGFWDAALQTSGKLDRTIGGPPYRLFTYKQENIAFYGPAESYGPETWRRGLYRMTVRAVRDNLLASLDCPESAIRSARRESTVTPLQAMTLLNGAFTRQQAAFFAERVRREAGSAPERQLERAWQLAFARLPNPDERTLARPLLARDGLPALCRALLNANEFLYY